MRVCHFEDALVADLEPLTLTRPVFDLLCGCNSLGDKQVRYFSLARGQNAATPPLQRGALVRPHLAPLTARQAPRMHVNHLSWLRGESVLLVNGRWVPPAPSTEGWEDLDTPCVGLVEGEVAYAVLRPRHLTDCSPLTLDACLEEWKQVLPARPAGGWMAHYLWDLVERNGEEIALDAWLTEPERQRRGSDLPALVGPADRLLVHPTARIDPLVVADTSNGPVILDRDVVVTAFTRLEGPCYVGPATQLIGAKLRGGSTLGPQCRIGGEVEASIVQGYSNKYHDGFLGHAYIGEWVNLGAGTSNSDLRNDYGPVRVSVNGTMIDTRRSKIGCFIGDHTKTGLGTLLNTGTSAGIFCNLLPTGGLLPKVVPSFGSIWNGMPKENSDLEQLLATAVIVMKRRGETLTAAHEKLYSELFNRTADVRRQVLREAELRRLRRTA